VGYYDLYSNKDADVPLDWVEVHVTIPALANVHGYVPIGHRVHESAVHVSFEWFLSFLGPDTAGV
jgi:hypothetical protein